MHSGQQVSFTDSTGKHHTATVTAIAGTGASGNKTLDLAFGDEAAEKVPHGSDRESGKGFWLLEGEEVVSATPKARRRKR